MIQTSCSLRSLFLNKILLFWVLSTVERENSLCSISLFWEITWCLFFFPLSSFSWLFTSHALSEWHKPADLGVELRSFMRLHHKARGGFGGSKFKPKLLGRDSDGACVCPSSHRKYRCLLVCVCLFLGAEILTKAAARPLKTRRQPTIQAQIDWQGHELPGQDLWKWEKLSFK